MANIREKIIIDELDFMVNQSVLHEHYIQERNSYQREIVFARHLQDPSLPILLSGYKTWEADLSEFLDKLVRKKEIIYNFLTASPELN